MADITFMGLHGSIGEDGKLQATFDVLGIRYTGPKKDWWMASVYSSSVWTMKTPILEPLSHGLITRGR